ncbi:MAG TPA: plastocyanin/azurin family copper-binding protein [Vicinamibacterales bacterium]|nr:plastocyanin/azurin family copper-binding protein [Vicinamibacterales bacterium]
MLRRRFILTIMTSAALASTALLAQTKPAAPAQGKPAPAAKAAAGARTVDIVGTDDMKYSVTTITAKPGEQLRVRLTSKGTMPKIAMAHNFVLLKLTASPVKFVQAGATARATDFIAPETKDQVLAATTLAGNGETVEVTFKVPAAVGSYPYLCTFPGHFQAGMRGTLEVKK